MNESDLRKFIELRGFTHGDCEDDIEKLQARANHAQWEASSGSNCKLGGIAYRKDQCFNAVVAQALNGDHPSTDSFNLVGPMLDSRH